MNYYFYKDLKLSAFCLGCAQFGQKYGISNKNAILNESETKSIIKRTIDSGINFFDTAADYGNSEEILGKILALYKNKDLVIATKIKYIKDKFINSKTIKKEIQSSLESSLKKLQRDYLDIVYIHQYLLFFSFPEIFLEVLNNYKKKGFIRYIGISLYEPYEINKALEYDEIDIFQIPYNVLNRDFEESNGINLLKQKEKLIILRNIFLQGLFFLSLNNLPKYFKPVQKTLKTFYKEIKKKFNSKEEFFLGYVLNKYRWPIILGVYFVSQLKKNLSIFDSPPSKEIFKKVESKIPNISKAYTDPRNWFLNK